MIFRRLSPFPFARVPVVAGDMALDHFVAPLIARHDEGSEVAAAEAKRGERHHYKDLAQHGCRRSILPQQVGELSNVRRNPSCLIPRQQLRR